MASRQYHERQHEYFISGEGISREVIQADICRYLGNDALGQPGYLIRAYRNLTSEMISDLKSDSARWEDEVRRRDNLGYSRGTYIHDLRRSRSPNSPPAPYSESSIHELRQQGGPTSTQAYSTVATQYMDTYGQNLYPGQTTSYPVTTAPYQAGTFQTTQAGYTPSTLQYSQPQSHGYGLPSQTVVTYAEQPSSYIHTSGQPYTYEPARNAAPRYSGPTYSSESDYSPVTSPQAYPVTTTTAPERMSMDTRFTTETTYQSEHRGQPTRQQPSRDREGRRGAR